MATLGKLTVNELIVNSDIQANQLAVTSDVQFSGPVVCSDIVYLDGGANSDLVSGLNADMFDGAQLDTDVDLAADSSAKVPSQHAVKTYVDGSSTVVHTTGDETISGTKTFDTDIVGDLDGGIVEQGTGGATLKCKVIEIGNWDMDATASVTVSHGLNFSKIRVISGVIYDDAGTWKYPIPWSYAAGGSDADIVMEYNSTTIKIDRLTGGYFDTTDFDTAVFNRGHVTIWYEA